MTSPMFDPEAVRLWLRVLHEGNPGRIHVASTAAWSGPSYPCTDIDGAVRRVVELDAGRPLGVYARMTTLAAPLGRGQRGGNADSLALLALWADIDIAGAAHKDANLPPDWAAAEQIVATSGLPVPSLMVDSGHGMYPIWLLDPVHVLTAGDLADVADLSANWQRIIAAASNVLGYHYGEGVGDLARVLRIPGTVNRKAGTEKACRLTGHAGPRYSLAELRERCAETMARIEPAPTPTPVSRVSGSVTPRPVSSPGRTAPGEVSPGDDYAARTTWADILEPHGWRQVRARGDVVDWCRPGKDDGISATTNGTGTDRFHVFSTSTVFDTTSYSKFGAFAVLEHGGDHSAAAAALKALGYGEDDTAHIEAYLAGLSDTLPPMPGEQEDRSSGNDTGSDRSPPPGDTPAEVLDARTLAELRFRADVAAEIRRQQIAKEARAQVSSIEFAKTWAEPPSLMSLAEHLAAPDVPLQYRVAKILAVDGNAVLTAAFKAGKTTLCNNLLRSLADGEPFLDRFDVIVPAGRIASFNYEVSERQYIGWLRRIGIKNVDRVSPLNLRGHSLPLTDPHTQDFIVKWLTDHATEVWIVDPFARAMVGSGDENSNMDVGVVLDLLDQIKRRAGVGELILPTHTGRAGQQAGAERARGATRLDDWADARWLLTVDDQSRRFFRANGRDVDVDEELLSFDPATGRLTMGGHDRRGMARSDDLDEIVEWVRDNPGLGKDEIVATRGGNRNRTYGQLSAAVAARRLYTTAAPRNKLLHFATPHLLTPGGQRAE